MNKPTLKKCPPASTAFTLIELLVVLVVTAILIAILLPTLNSARGSAKSTECLSNLRSILVAVQNSATEKKDRLPSTVPAGEGDHVKAFKQYLKSEYGSGAWLCPSHDQFIPNSRSTSSYGYNWQHLLEPNPDIGYPYNYYYGFEQPGMRQDLVSRPSSTLTYADHHSQGIIWTYIQRPGDTSSVNGMGRFDTRHGQQRGNAAFLDGHAEVMGKELGDPENEDKYWAAIR